MGGIIATVIGAVIVALVFGIAIKERYVYNIKLKIKQHMLDAIIVLVSLVAIIIMELKDKNSRLGEKLSIAFFTISNISIVVSIFILQIEATRERSKKNVYHTDASQYFQSTGKKVQSAYQLCREGC